MYLPPRPTPRPVYMLGSVVPPPCIIICFFYYKILLQVLLLFKMIIRLLRFTADLSNEPQRTTHAFLLLIKKYRRRQCAHEIALSTGGRNVVR